MSEKSAREMLRWTAQTVHQGYHLDSADNSDACQKDICSSIHTWLRNNLDPEGRPCSNCKSWPGEHVLGKCLFDSAQYQEMTKEEFAEWRSGDNAAEYFDDAI